MPILRFHATRPITPLGTCNSAHLPTNIVFRLPPRISTHIVHTNTINTTHCLLPSLIYIPLPIPSSLLRTTSIQINIMKSTVPLPSPCTFEDIPLTPFRPYLPLRPDPPSRLRAILRNFIVRTSIIVFAGMILLTCIALAAVFVGRALGNAR
jgi:hypothetical protein